MKIKLKTPHRGLPPPPPDALSLSLPPHPVAPLAMSQLLEEMNLFPTPNPGMTVSTVPSEIPLNPSGLRQPSPHAGRTVHPLTPAPPPAPGLKVPLSGGLPGLQVSSLLWLPAPSSSLS